MTITANTYDMRTLPSAGKDWHVSLQTEDARGCEAIKAAESGHSHYITKLIIRGDSGDIGGMDISVGSGGDDGDAVTTVHFGPIPLRKVHAGTVAKIFNWKAPRGMGIKCTSGLSVAIDNSVIGTLWVEAYGRTCKD